MSDLEPNYGRRMSNAEAVLLCRYAKAACPQQAFDQYTPDAWGDLLGDLRFEDCKEALRNIVQRQPFVAPAEIRSEVKRVRGKRIADYGPLPNPPYGTDYDQAEYRAYLGDLMRRIGDGEIVTAGDEQPFGEIKRDVVRELGKAGQDIDTTEKVQALREARAKAVRELQEAQAEAKRAEDERRAAQKARRDEMTAPTTTSPREGNDE